MKNRVRSSAKNERQGIYAVSRCEEVAGPINEIIEEIVVAPKSFEIPTLVSIRRCDHAT